MLDPVDYHLRRDCRGARPAPGPRNSLWPILPPSASALLLSMHAFAPIAMLLHTNITHFSRASTPRDAPEK